MDKTESYLYKYRSISNFRYFVDILLKKRLYGAKYNDLNDPFEGILLVRSEQMSSSLQEHKRDLQQQRKNYRVCSLSKVHDNNLMWAHYADGHKGCCIELSVEEDPKWSRLDVEYGDKALDIDEDTTIEQVLSHKLSPWSYEEEVRFISDSESQFLKVRINKIYLGCKMSGFDRTFVSELIQKIDSSIKVEDMPKSSFIY